jgi:hypothetical protein
MQMSERSQDLRTLVFVLLLAVALTATVPDARATVAGTDILMPAAARVGTWVTDLYVFNPGQQTVGITIYWLVRDQANPSPLGVAYTLGPGATLVLEDLIKHELGLDSGTGAFRVVADDDVVVSSRIYQLQQGVTFGQGLEGVPRDMALGAGDSTDIAGLSSNQRFRTNVVLIDASGTGAVVELSLRDTAGDELASRTYSLDAFEPALDPVSELVGVTDFDHGSLHAEVTSGSALILASKVDNDPSSGDPTTLEPWTAAGGGIDGTYQIAIYDSGGYATGGSIKVRSSSVTEIHASYTNWDKGSPLDPDCLITFLWGTPEAGTHPLAEYEHGVSFDQEYDAGATIRWTLTMSVDRNQSLTGVLEAVGSGFSGDRSGCNGEFPPLELLGGKHR